MEKIWNVTEFMSEVRTRKERKEGRKKGRRWLHGCDAVGALDPRPYIMSAENGRRLKNAPKLTTNSTQNLRTYRRRHKKHRFGGRHQWKPPQMEMEQELRVAQNSRTQKVSGSA